MSGGGSLAIPSGSRPEKRHLAVTIAWVKGRAAPRGESMTPNCGGDGERREKGSEATALRKLSERKPSFRRVLAVEGWCVRAEFQRPARSHRLQVAERPSQVPGFRVVTGALETSHRHHNYLTATFKAFPFLEKSLFSQPNWVGQYLRATLSSKEAVEVLLGSAKTLELQTLVSLQLKGSEKTSLQSQDMCFNDCHFQVVQQHVRSLRDLADGELLLQIMRDINPQDRRFRDFSGSGTALDVLRAGLQQHFAGRTRHLPASLLRIMLLAERFSEEPETPEAGGVSGRASSAFGSMMPRSSELALPDFLEVGLDPETRFRRLKEQLERNQSGSRHYIALKEEQERWEEDRQKLMSDLESERSKRLEAQETCEKERLARAELRVAEEAQDRLREEQRAALEMTPVLAVERYQSELRQKDAEMERLREELEVARVESQKAQKLQSQLEIFKKRLEECQVWKREKEELRRQLDEITSSNKAGSGTVEHLHGRLAALRDELQTANRERDQAQLQVKLLQGELEQATLAASTGPAPATAPAAAPLPATLPVAPVASQLAAEEREELRAANRELQSQVALRERELQVFHWRSQAESNTLKAQESLMASCFHELGLRLHQLQLQNAQLQKRTGDGRDMDEET
ncbi:unnamed protein product [Durusdinium trenchii]|uniref:Uncharacterized protein n=1 Tax=Durusdinium trenchii TaxID=1381693 RepID=A0ABP0R132_9DINO